MTTGHSGRPADDDHRAVTDLLHRYATAVDTRDWPLLGTCFVADVDADYGDLGRWGDLDGLVAFMEAAHVGFGATNHLLSNIVVEIDGERADRARATSYVHAVLTFLDDPTRWVDSVGTYRDALVRTSDGWRIARRRFTTTRITTGGGA